MTIYALKGNSEWCDILSSLKLGEGRFGWSYIETANLHNLKIKIEQQGWNALNEKEKDCYQGFLLNIKENDYAVYINVPEWGKCTLAKVTGKYVWRFNDEDFNHRFPVDPNTVYTFDRNDVIVHPALSARLKLQGRWWQIYLKEEFESLLGSLQQGKTPVPRTPKTNLYYLSNEIQPLLSQITERIHHTHPNYDLEGLVAEVFKNIPGVIDVILQGGSGDHGADILVTFESGIPLPGLEQQLILVIQVKSFEGEHWDTTAVNDIRRAFEKYQNANMGLIVSTANMPSSNLKSELDKLREESGKPVTLLIGSDVAAFFLRFGSKLFN